jgi:hypothetical protein
MSVTFAGVTVGPLVRNLRDGLNLKVILSSVEGDIIFSFIKEKEVLVYMDLIFTHFNLKDRQHLKKDIKLPVQKC